MHAIANPLFLKNTINKNPREFINKHWFYINILDIEPDYDRLRT